MKIDGKHIAQKILDDLKPKINSLKNNGIAPTLAIILIGNNKSSQVYIKQKQIKADEIGVIVKLFEFEEIEDDRLLTLIKKLNNDAGIHGIIVQRPLPKNINKNKISNAIEKNKDVDGFREDSKFDAPVALAVVKILNSIGINRLNDKKITVIGKGETAGFKSSSIFCAICFPSIFIIYK